ncbi:caspase family protein [Acidobacterium sp. S8]|uniref:caspase family protein n=1 Tax=Acidobacterium sp. S8 TaxID=1641854 RepID=UPI00131C74CF|nr:caspase family protein [Acidobacterium sp. S8]
MYRIAIPHRSYLALFASLIALATATLPANAQDRGIVSLKAANPTPTQTGRPNFYALVIGIRSNPYLPPLETPLNDAKEVEQTLKNEYGFNTQLLIDATRDQIIGALDHYRRTLTENDELLIYYAGHGFYDKDVDQAYWAPVDANTDTYSRWIIATEITGTAKAVPARHVLIISDSCYSGMLSRGAGGAGPATNLEDHSAYLERMLDRKSRNVMSSGGDEPVQDNDGQWGPTNHSVFANVLLRNLTAPPADEFTAEELFSHVRIQVAARSTQTPTYTPIRDSLHDEGDFVFYRVGHAGEVQPSPSNISYLPPPSVDPEKDAIGASLDKYEDAYASMDMHLMKAVWPSLSRAQEKALNHGISAPGLKAVRVQLRNIVETHDAGTAKVKCDQWMVYTWAGKRQPPQVNSVEILLTKNQQGSWLVNDVRPK